ncbi:WLM domain-containing protein [Fennellomyces sp. T-0311]|nr:WLM domain-containing protein [Fennellomyces sp. T-0311]
MADSVDLKVQYKTKVFEIHQWSPESTVGQLKSYLQDETSIPIANQRLIHGGKILKNDNDTLLQFNSSKFKLIGTPVEQVKEIAKLDDKLTHRHVIKTSRPTKSVQTTNPYTFHRITVIEEFPNPNQARKLLEQLRDDRGIKEIMRQRQWSVGELTELTPFEASILGFNRNAGQLISIRLRTDDLSGFRNYNSIRKVLLHELTHNVHSEHDDKFHALNRQLNKDVIALDWTAHGAHALSSGSSFYQPDDGDVDTMDDVSWQGGTYRLGGGGDGNSSMDAALQRELRAKAAATRLTKQEEQELDEGCDTRH